MNRFVLLIILLFSVPCIAQTLDVLEQFDTAPELKDAMLEAVKQNPQAKQWSGATDNFVFGIGTATFDNDDEKNITKGTAHLLAVKEMLLAKVLLDEYGKYGLTNVPVLKTAIMNVADALNAKGTVKYIDNKTFRNGNTFTNIITADRKAKIAATGQVPSLTVVKNAYYKELFRSYIANEKSGEAEKMIAVYQNDLAAINLLYGIANQYEKHIERLTKAKLNLDELLNH